MTVPVLYRGPWHGISDWALAEGQSTIADHIREGFVVKPVDDILFCEEVGGRLILKLHGEGYLTRKLE